MDNHLKAKPTIMKQKIWVEMAMEFTGWDIIITLIIAMYGAILSTYSIWNARQEHRREVKVRLSYGFSTHPFAPQGLLLIIEALNTGRKTVTLSSTGLILPTKDKKYYTFLRPNSNVTFPYDLPEGKNCSVWIGTKELSENLKQEGYSGKIELKGYYGDAIGGKYKSKSIKFDIDKP
jgi:hypothetical protein